MNEKEALDSISESVMDIKTTNNNIIKIAESLKIILLNLKIEDARIKGNTGIIPIAEALEKNINMIENNLKSLIDKDEDVLVNSIETISKYMEEQYKLND